MMDKWESLSSGFFKKSGTAGTHVRTVPVIIMANDVSIRELTRQKVAYDSYTSISGAGCF
mgnify:CR=1 FL=1